MPNASQVSAAALVFIALVLAAWAGANGISSLGGTATPAFVCNASLDGFRCTFSNTAKTRASGRCVIGELAGKKRLDSVPLCSGPLDAMTSVAITGDFTGGNIAETCQDAEGTFDWSGCKLTISEVP